MLLARSVAEPFGEVRQHRLEHLRIHRGGGVVVEIDRSGHQDLRSVTSGVISSSIGGSAAISWSEQVTSAATIRSLSRHSGSRTLHFAYWPQLSTPVEHAVTVNGPSIAWMMSATEIALDSRPSRYPPRVPWCDVSRPRRASRCSTFAISSIGMSYCSAISRALAEAASERVARCFIAMSA